MHKLPSSAYVLAPPRAIAVHNGSNGKLQLVNNDERVLFVNYCLVRDRWLCTSVVDNTGHLMDTALINLDVSAENRLWRYKNKSQVNDALSRLWLYIQGFLSSCGEGRNWRLVIGRLGRIGHMEYRGRRIVE